MTPFVKWLGSKRAIASMIADEFAAGAGLRYVEPMIGSGAVMLALAKRGWDLRGAMLADANIYLVRAWRGCVSEPSRVKGFVQAHAVSHCEDYFLLQRSRQAEILNQTDVGVAAWFIYINKASFNGLWRVTNSGVLNASWGKRKPADIKCPPDFVPTMQKLRDLGIHRGCFAIADAVESVDRASEACIFVDPPYVGSFDRYTAEIFTDEKHSAVAAACYRAAERGCFVVVCQSDKAGGLYDPFLLAYPGARKVPVTEYRRVSRKAESRGETSDIMYVLGGENA